MEHIVQFGVTIDDETIQRHVMNKATEDIIREIKKELGCTKYSTDESTISKLVETHCGEFLEGHKEEIIEAAAKYLAEKLARTKLVKEATQRAIKDILED